LKNKRIIETQSGNLVLDERLTQIARKKEKSSFIKTFNDKKQYYPWEPSVFRVQKLLQF